MHIYSKLACFIGGALFGSAGIKLLTSKDAKKVYTHVTAAGLRMKDSVMETVTLSLIHICAPEPQPTSRSVPLPS